MTSSSSPPRAPSEKSRGVATALAAILGLFGAHRFYLGKSESGALMLLTLGGLGIWWLYDLILVASGSFRDDEGGWSPGGPRKRRPAGLHCRRKSSTKSTSCVRRSPSWPERLDFAGAAARPAERRRNRHPPSRPS